MAGCSIVVLLSLFAIASLSVLIAIFGTTAFCLVLGITFLILSFTFLKKKNDLLKYRRLRITFIIIGVISLLIAAGGIFILIASYIVISQ